MKLEPFAMERMQSTWENIVEFNLSESGVHPMSLNELLYDDPDELSRLMNVGLGYVQSNGTIPLREKIAALYPGSTPDHILVTTGTSEANHLNLWSLVEEGDEVVFMLPNYMQIWGIARGYGGNVRSFSLSEELEWHPDLEAMRKAVNSKTKLICVCNPNNPTGSILTRNEMQEIVSIAQKHGAWLLCDEVYQGAERDRERTPSFWGSYERVIVTNGLSKAYGIPGIRIGWVVAPPEHIAKLWSYHDYTTIGPGALSDRIAQIALTPHVREKILARTRQILNSNYPVLLKWIRDHGETFSLIEPHAGAIAYLKYRLNMNSTELVEKLRKEKSVLIVPGDHFGMDHFLRIGYGSPVDDLHIALDRIHETLSSVHKRS
jgi:aspartate/methionine/tyrosine aminotransferase